MRLGALEIVLMIYLLSSYGTTRSLLTASSM